MSSKRRRIFSFPRDEAEAREAKRIAGQALHDDLLGLYAFGKLPAAKLCTTAYHAVEAGADSPIAAFALAPGQSTGNYQKQVEKAMATLNIKKIEPMELFVPGQSTSKKCGSI